jgi:hypothetical protein
MSQILHITHASWTAAAALLIAAASTPAYAQIQGPPGNNSFCAMYNDSSTLDCSFGTFAQCQAAISGVGGICQANNLPQGRYLPQRGPQLFPTDPFGLYRNRSQDMPPVPPPP